MPPEYDASEIESFLQDALHWASLKPRTHPSSLGSAALPKQRQEHPVKAATVQLIRHGDAAAAVGQVAKSLGKKTHQQLLALHQNDLAQLLNQAALLGKFRIGMPVEPYLTVRQQVQWESEFSHFIEAPIPDAMRWNCLSLMNNVLSAEQPHIQFDLPSHYIYEEQLNAATMTQLLLEAREQCKNGSLLTEYYAPLDALLVMFVQQTPLQRFEHRVWKAAVPLRQGLQDLLTDLSQAVSLRLVGEEEEEEQGEQGEQAGNEESGYWAEREGPPRAGKYRVAVNSNLPPAPSAVYDATPGDLGQDRHVFMGYPANGSVICSQQVENASGNSSSSSNSNTVSVSHDSTCVTLPSGDGRLTWKAGVAEQDGHALRYYSNVTESMVGVDTTFVEVPSDNAEEEVAPTEDGNADKEDQALEEGADGEERVESEGVAEEEKKIRNLQLETASLWITTKSGLHVHCAQDGTVQFVPTPQEEKSPSQEVRRTILPTGHVCRYFADQSVLIYHPNGNISSCSAQGEWKVTANDGTVTTRTPPTPPVAQEMPSSPSTSPEDDEEGDVAQAETADNAAEAAPVATEDAEGGAVMTEGDEADEQTSADCPSSSSDGVQVSSVPGAVTVATMTDPATKIVAHTRSDGTIIVLQRNGARQITFADGTCIARSASEPPQYTITAEGMPHVVLWMQSQGNLHQLDLTELSDGSLVQLKMENQSMELLSSDGLTMLLSTATGQCVVEGSELHPNGRSWSTSTRMVTDDEDAVPSNMWACLGSGDSRRLYTHDAESNSFTVRCSGELQVSSNQNPAALQEKLDALNGPNANRPISREGGALMGRASSAGTQAVGGIQPVSCSHQPLLFAVKEDGSGWRYLSEQQVECFVARMRSNPLATILTEPLKEGDATVSMTFLVRPNSVSAPEVEAPGKLPRFLCANKTTSAASPSASSSLAGAGATNVMTDGPDGVLHFRQLIKHVAPTPTELLELEAALIKYQEWLEQRELYAETLTEEDPRSEEEKQQAASVLEAALKRKRAKAAVMNNTETHAVESYSLMQEEYGGGDQAEQVGLELKEVRPGTHQSGRAHSSRSLKRDPSSSESLGAGASSKNEQPQSDVATLGQTVVNWDSALDGAAVQVAQDEREQTLGAMGALRQQERALDAQAEALATASRLSYFVHNVEAAHFRANLDLPPLDPRKLAKKKQHGGQGGREGRVDSQPAEGIEGIDGSSLPLQSEDVSAAAALSQHGEGGNVGLDALPGSHFQQEGHAQLGENKNNGYSSNHNGDDVVGEDGYGQAEAGSLEGGEVEIQGHLQDDVDMEGYPPEEGEEGDHDHDHDGLSTSVSQKHTLQRRLMPNGQGGSTTQLVRVTHAQAVPNEAYQLVHGKSMRQMSLCTLPAAPGAFQVLPSSAAFGVLPLHCTFRMALQITNINYEVCRFRVKNIASPDIRLIYQPGPLAPGISQLFEAEVTCRQEGPVEELVEIVTPGEIIAIPVAALVVREEEYRERVKVAFQENAQPITNPSARLLARSVRPMKPDVCPPKVGERRISMGRTVEQQQKLLQPVRTP